MAITVFSGHEPEAILAQQYLQNNGINAELVDQNIGRTAPYLAAPGGAGAVKVIVPEGEAEAARILLENTSKPPSQ